MRLSTSRRTWERWQACAGPWRGWSVCPALLAPELETITPRRVPRTAARRVVDGLAESLRRGGILLLVDLEPTLGVQIAALLNERRLANGVLVLPRWPYREACLPVDGLLHALVGQARRLAPAEHLPNVAFVLDAERTQSLGQRSPRDPRADNRYRLSVSDLPDLAALRARGIDRVVKLSAR